MFHNNVRPTCVCGCGKETEFYTLQRGFNSYVKGHNARVHNGWGHNPKAHEKSRQTQIEMWKRGELKSWREGLSPDDPRNAKLIQKMTTTIRANKSLLKQKSEAMKGYWTDGRIVPLKGKDHSQWKGGVSALQPLCRSYVFRAWSFPKMKVAGFKCTVCQAPGPGLEVHHDKERFAEILQKAISALGEPGEDFNKKVAFAEWVTDYHLENDVSGVVLCERCHDEEHC